MRLDDAGPRTWLLAAFAGWSLVVYLMAIAGMGRDVDALPDDPSLNKPLPAVPAAGTNRLGPLEQYQEIYSRPLFSVDRKPKNFSLQEGGSDADSGAFDYVLTSVMITPNLEMALLQSADGSKSAAVKVGEAPESHPAWRLSSLGPRSAVFDGPEGQKVLDLRVFDGQGGQAPTAVAGPPAGGERRDGIVDGGRGEAKGDPEPILPPPPPPPPPALGDSGMISAGEGAPPGAPPQEQKADAPMTEQAQMEAIRQRIQARRAQLRQQQQEQQNQQEPTP